MKIQERESKSEHVFSFFNINPTPTHRNDRNFFATLTQQMYQHKGKILSQSHETIFLGGVVMM
jgi:hypothetical protein